MDLEMKSDDSWEKKIAFYGFNVHVLVAILILFAADTVSASANCPHCLPKDMETTTSKCQEQGVYLGDSEASKNSTIVCSALHELFICIAQHIPQCLEKVGSKYERYILPPWNCTMDSHIKQYQEIVHSGCDLLTGLKPIQSGDQSSYKMADSQTKNSTSAGIALFRYESWHGMAVSMSLGLIFQFYDSFGWSL